MWASAQFRTNLGGSITEIAPRAVREWAPAQVAECDRGALAAAGSGQLVRAWHCKATIYDDDGATETIEP